MGNWEQLKDAISQVIKTNGNQEITGSVLQNVLLNMVSNLGENIQFAGIAKPTTNPGTPDGNVYYFAVENGTYSNFDAIELKNEIAILTNQNGSWEKINTNFIAKLGSGNVFDWYNTDIEYQRNKEILTTCILDFYSNNLIVEDKYFSYPLYMTSYGRQDAQESLIFQLYYYDEDLGDFPWYSVATFYILKTEYEQAIANKEIIEKTVYPFKSGSITIRIKPVISFEEWNRQVSEQKLVLNNGNFFRNENYKSKYGLKLTNLLNNDNIMSKAFLRAVTAPQIKAIRFYDVITTDGIFNRITLTLNKLENLQNLRYKIYKGNKPFIDLRNDTIGLTPIQEGLLSESNVSWNENIGNNVVIDMFNNINVSVSEYIIIELSTDDETALNPLCYYNSLTDTVNGSVPPQNTHTFYIKQISNNRWGLTANKENLWYIQPTIILENYVLENKYFVYSSDEFIKELFVAIQLNDDAKIKYIEDRNKGYLWVIGEVRTNGRFAIYAYDYLYKNGDGSNAGYYIRYKFDVTPNTGLQVVESNGNYVLVDTDKFPASNKFVLKPLQSGLTEFCFVENNNDVINNYILNKKIENTDYSEDDLKLLLPNKIHVAKGLSLSLYKDSISRIKPIISSSIFSLPIPDDAINADKEIDKPQIDDNVLSINNVKGCGKMRIGYIDNLNIKNRIIYKDCQLSYTEQTSGKNIKGLVIGDSITNRGVAAFTKKSIENVGSVLETFGTLNNKFNAKGEGREGWKWSDFIGRSTLVAGNRIEPMEAGTTGSLYKNPFVRVATSEDYQNYPKYCYRNMGSSNELSYESDPDKTGVFYIFDFDYYLKRWGDEKPNIPGIISIALGTNDVLRENVDDIIENAIFMVQRIREVLPTVKIAIIPSPAWGINTNQSTYDKVVQYIFSVIDSFDSQENIDVIGLWAFMSRILSFGIKEKQEIDQSTYSAIYADNVHFDKGTEGNGYRAYIEYANVLASWILNVV